MKRWIRIGTVAVAAVTALVLGLSSASAGPTGRPTPSAPPPTTTPLAGGHTPAFLAAPQVAKPPAKSETLFYPVTPCRIVDTRSGGGILTNNKPRVFYVTGTFGFAPQGGKSGGCGIPTAATGITTNVTVVGSTAEGYLTGYPTGATAPLTNFISLHKNFTLTANPTFPLAAANTRPLTITDHGGSTHLIIDVTGYYVPQIEGLVSTSGAPYSGSPRILSSTKVSTGVFQVTVDTDVSFCTPTVTPYLGTGYYASAYDFNVNVVQVDVWTLSSTGQPVPSDGVGYFYLNVIC